MSLFDIAGDAQRAFTVLQHGGAAIVPHSIGYAALGGSAATLRRIYLLSGELRQECGDLARATTGILREQARRWLTNSDLLHEDVSLTIRETEEHRRRA